MRQGTVTLLPPGTAYTAIGLPPLSTVRAEVLGADEEAHVARLCPVPRTVGVHSAEHGGWERGFLLVLPSAAGRALEWSRALCDASGSTPCVLLRAKEYTRVSADFGQRLLAQSSGGKKLLDAACKGRLVGLHLAADGVLAELSHRARKWNGSELAVYATQHGQTAPISPRCRSSGLVPSQRASDGARPRYNSVAWCGWERPSHPDANHGPRHCHQPRQ